MDIDLLDDVALQQQMVHASMLILLVGVLAGVALQHEDVGIGWFVLLALASLVALPVHELVHAGAFALLSGFSARICFGFSDWMLYTSAAGVMLPKRRFCVVLLAPTFLVTTVLVLVPALLGMPLLGWFAAVLHLAGCTGDMAYVRIIAREPMATHVEDTERGISLLHDE